MSLHLLFPRPVNFACDRCPRKLLLLNFDGPVNRARACQATFPLNQNPDTRNDGTHFNFEIKANSIERDRWIVTKAMPIVFITCDPPFSYNRPNCDERKRVVTPGHQLLIYIRAELKVLLIPLYFRSTFEFVCWFSSVYFCRLIYFVQR